MSTKPNKGINSWHRIQCIVCFCLVIAAALGGAISGPVLYNLVLTARGGDAWVLHLLVIVPLAVSILGTLFCFLISGEGRGIAFALLGLLGGSIGGLAGIVCFLRLVGIFSNNMQVPQWMTPWAGSCIASAIACVVAVLPIAIIPIIVKLVEEF